MVRLYVNSMICYALLPYFLALTVSNWEEFVVVTRSTHTDEIFPIGIYTFQIVHHVCNKISCFIVLINSQIQVLASLSILQLPQIPDNVKCKHVLMGVCTGGVEGEPVV